MNQILLSNLCDVLSYTWMYLYCSISILKQIWWEIYLIFSYSHVFYHICCFILLQSGDEWVHSSTTWDWFPWCTTGNICWGSPLNTVGIPPEGSVNAVYLVSIIHHDLIIHDECHILIQFQRQTQCSNLSKPDVLDMFESLSLSKVWLSLLFSLVYQ